MKLTRNTLAKTEIQNLLNKSKNALSHNEIKTALEGVCDRVTIYRVLDRLIAENIVHKIVNVDGIVKFASCHSCSSNHVHNDNHIHFSCIKCKSVTCLENTIPAFKLPENYTVQETNFTISGVCPECI